MTHLKWANQWWGYTASKDNSSNDSYPALESPRALTRDVKVHLNSYLTRKITNCGSPRVQKDTYMPLETLILSSQVCCTKEGGKFSYSQKNIQISSYSRVSLKPIIPSTSSKLDHRIPLSATTSIGSNSHFLLFHIRISRHSSQKTASR